MDRQKVKEFLIKTYPEVFEDESIGTDPERTLEENGLIEEMSLELDQKDLINFTIEYRENMSDEGWLQANYYKKEGNIGITLNYDVNTYYDNAETSLVDCFMNTLEELQNNQKRIEEMLNVKQTLQEGIKEIESDIGYETETLLLCENKGLQKAYIEGLKRAIQLLNQ